jgi:hypothetical protein
VDEMTPRVAIFCVNYRTNELVDSLKAIIEPSTTEYMFFEVDNGNTYPNRPTAVKSARNVYMSPAQRMAVEYAKGIEVIDNFKFEYFWFLVTCCSLVTKNDPLTQMVTFLDEHPNCAIIHQGMDQESNTAWPNLKAKGNVPRRTYAVDNVSIMIRSEYYDLFGGVDRRYMKGWCVGLDWSYQARKMGKEVWILDNVLCHRTEAIGWKLGRRDVTREAYNLEAAAEMDKTVQEKFHFPIPQAYERLNFDYGGREFENK